MYPSGAGIYMSHTSAASAAAAGTELRTFVQLPFAATAARTFAIPTSASVWPVVRETNLRSSRKSLKAEAEELAGRRWCRLWRDDLCHARPLLCIPCGPFSRPFLGAPCALVVSSYSCRAKPRPRCNKQGPRLRAENHIADGVAPFNRAVSSHFCEAKPRPIQVGRLKPLFL